MGNLGDLKIIAIASIFLCTTACIYSSTPPSTTQNGGGITSGTSIPLSQNTVGNNSGSILSTGGDHYSTVQGVGLTLGTNAQTSDNGHYQNR